MTGQNGGGPGDFAAGAAGGVGSGSGPSHASAPSGEASAAEQAIGISLKHAEMLAAQGRYEDALEALRPGLAVDPEHASLRYTRGWLLLTQWRLDEARATFEALLGEHPEIHDARRLLSLTLLRQGLHAQAEREIDRCLAADPSDPLHQLQLARVYIVSLPERRDKRRLKRAARECIDRALAFAAGNPAVFEEAGRALWSLGREREALDTVQRGLAEAPQYAGLLDLHADLVTANTPSGGYDNIQKDMVHAAQMGKLLAGDSQHREARVALFQQLWFRSMVRIDSQLYLIPIATLGLVVGFAGGIAHAWGVAVWWVIAGIGAAVQWFKYRVVSGSVPPGLRRRVSGTAAVDKARRWGERVGLVCALAVGVAAVVVAAVWRDAVVVRWLTVALSVLVMVALVCSVLWQLGYAVRSRAFEGVTIPDRDAVARLAAHRRGLATIVLARCMCVIGLWVLFQIVFTIAGSDPDRGGVYAVLLLGMSGMVLSPLVGWSAAWVAELRARRELGPEVTVGVKAPAVWSPALAACVAACMLAMLVSGVSAVPVTANSHDAIGQYEKRQPAADDSGNETGDNTDEEPADTCSGTRSSRIACQLRKAQEHQNIELPDVKPLELPQVPDLKPIELPPAPDVVPLDMPEDPGAENPRVEDPNAPENVE